MSWPTSTAPHIPRPTEALNGRLEHLRGTALGFRNLTNSIVRALLDTGGFRPDLHRNDESVCDPGRPPSRAFGGLPVR